MAEPNLKQWRKRALAAEEELKIMHQMRRIDSEQEMAMARENAALRVALREVQETTNWAYGAIADKLGGV